MTDVNGAGSERVNLYDKKVYQILVYKQSYSDLIHIDNRDMTCVGLLRQQNAMLLCTIYNIIPYIGLYFLYTTSTMAYI